MRLRSLGDVKLPVNILIYGIKCSHDEQWNGRKKNCTWFLKYVRHSQRWNYVTFGWSQEFYFVTFLVSEQNECLASKKMGSNVGFEVLQNLIQNIHCCTLTAKRIRAREWVTYSCACTIQQPHKKEFLGTVLWDTVFCFVILSLIQFTRTPN
jgi:hypothetical protein